LIQRLLTDRGRGAGGYHSIVVNIKHTVGIWFSKAEKLITTRTAGAARQAIDRLNSSRDYFLLRDLYRLSPRALKLRQRTQAQTSRWEVAARR
jgi:hypothetical protein